MGNLSRALVVLLLFLPACPERKQAAPRPTLEQEDPPPRPVVNEAFIKRVFNPDALPANEALVLELDPAPGIEAVVAVDMGNRNYQVAVVRGNHKALSRAPLGGKILSHANVQHIGPFRRLEQAGDSRPRVMLPVATLVQRQWVCGVLVFRYRTESLALVGEMGSRCWNREAVGKQLDPYSLIKIWEEEGALRIGVTEDRGVRTYGWDETGGSYKPVKFKKRR
jgi:hypothetical protein